MWDFFSKNSVALIPNICVRTQDNSCSVSSSSLIPSGIGEFSIPWIQECFPHITLTTTSGTKIFPFSNLTRTDCDTLAKHNYCHRGQLKDSRYWGKNTLNNNSTLWTKRAESQRRWLISASHRLIYDKSLLTGDNISEPVEPDWAGRSNKRREEKRRRCVEQECCFSYFQMYIPNVGYPFVLNLNESTVMHMHTHTHTHMLLWQWKKKGRSPRSTRSSEKLPPQHLRNGRTNYQTFVGEKPHKCHPPLVWNHKTL